MNWTTIVILPPFSLMVSRLMDHHRHLSIGDIIDAPPEGHP